MTRLKCPGCGQAVIHPDASHHDAEGYASDLCDRCEDERDDDYEDVLDRVRRDDPDDDRYDRYGCIGADCVNPAFLHRSDECATAEQMEAYYAAVDDQEQR